MCPNDAKILVKSWWTWLTCCPILLLRSTLAQSSNPSHPLQPKMQPPPPSPHQRRRRQPRSPPPPLQKPLPAVLPAPAPPLVPLCPTRRTKPGRRRCPTRRFWRSYVSFSKLAPLHGGFNHKLEVNMDDGNVVSWDMNERHEKRQVRTFSQS